MSKFGETPMSAQILADRFEGLIDELAWLNTLPNFHKDKEILNRKNSIYNEFESLVYTYGRYVGKEFLRPYLISYSRYE